MSSSGGAAVAVAEPVEEEESKGYEVAEEFASSLEMPKERGTVTTLALAGEEEGFKDARDMVYSRDESFLRANVFMLRGTQRNKFFSVLTIIF